MFISSAWAQAADEAAKGPSTLISLLPLVIIFALFYLLIIRPQSKRIREHNEQVASLKPGDKVITGGGLFATVVKVGETDLTLEIARSLGFERQQAGGPLPLRRIVDIPFEDFAQARNALARHADGDYIFWQDADEVLVNGAQLRAWIDDNVFFDAFKIE